MFICVNGNRSQGIHHPCMVDTVTQAAENGLCFFIVRASIPIIVPLARNITHSPQGPPFTSADTLLTKNSHGGTACLLCFVEFPLTGIHHALISQGPGLPC